MDELYGIPTEMIATLCGVHDRTARRWKSGKTQMPETARMILAGDLGAFDPAWRGWVIRGGMLCAPNGTEMSPRELLGVPLLRLQLSAYEAKVRQVMALEEQPLPGSVPTLIG
jgi:hypothetical protein